MGTALFDIALVRRLALSEETRFITVSAENDCYRLGLTIEDVWETLADLGSPQCSFYKSMESERRPGDWFDVYHVLLKSTIIYLKFSVKTLAEGNEIVVVSFKEK